MNRSFGRSRWLATWLMALSLMCGGMAVVGAGEAVPAVPDPALEARVMVIAAELRCLVCQNQTLADSQAPLAVDLRRQIGEMLARGQSPAQINDYMSVRYGDFVHYRPPFKLATALLWLGPALLLAAGLAALFMNLRRRRRMGPEAFDPDEPVNPA